MATIEEFKKAVIAYQLRQKAIQLDCPNVTEDGLEGLLMFRRQRSGLFVFATMHVFPRVQLTTLMPKLGRLIDEDERLPARIEVFCSSALSPQHAVVLTDMMLKDYNVELAIFDKSALASVPEFENLLEGESAGFDEIDEAHKVLYSMLAEGSNVAEIKSNLVCSIIIFIIHEHGSINAVQLKEEAEKQLQHDVGSIQQEIKYLQRKGRIVKDKTNKDYLKLSDEERAAFEEIRRRSKHEEAAFHDEFISLLDNFGIPDGHQLLEQLKGLYVDSCGVNIDRRDKRPGIVKRKEEVFKAFRSTIQTYLNDEDVVNSFIHRLKDICLNNPFLDKIGASEKFLSLYRSSLLEQFINAKKKVVYIDTRVFMFYYCYLMAKGRGYPYWDDHSFRSAVNLMNLIERKKKDITSRIYEPYLGEVAGELQKALRTSWFNENVKLKLEFQTGNVFYNFYLFLLENGAFDKDKKVKSFVDMVKLFGFSNTNAESSSFIEDTIAAIRTRLPHLKMQLVKEDFFEQNIWEGTLKQWQVINSHSHSQKSPGALKSDAKQLLHLMTQPLLLEKKEQDFYYASWDKSFIEIRDWVMGNNNGIHTFFAYNPAKMATRFALSHFKIDTQCITHDVFFYADNKFCLSNKISNLYDHVIIPYFGTKDEGGLEIINKIVEIQQKYLVQSADETVEDEGDDRLPLEIVFDRLKSSLKDWQCSEAELMAYLTSKDKQKDVLSFFEQAFDAIKKRSDYTLIVSAFGDSFKLYLHDTNKIDEYSV